MSGNDNLSIKVDPATETITVSGGFETMAIILEILESRGIIDRDDFMRQMQTEEK